jgi:hypothetical protein
LYRRIPLEFYDADIKIVCGKLASCYNYSAEYFISLVCVSYL